MNTKARKQSDGNLKLAGQKMKSFLQKYAWIGGLVGVIVTIFGFKEYVSSTARNAVLEESFLSEIAKKVRPSVVFDSNGLVIGDSGGLEYFEPPTISTVPTGRTPLEQAFQIKLHSKRFLSQPPEIRSVDGSLYCASVERVPPYSWEYRFQSVLVKVSGGGGGNIGGNILAPPVRGFQVIDTNKTYMFRVEVLH